MIPWLDRDTPFPEAEHALTEAQGAPGLLAAGADLSPQRLIDAYRQGIFPWFSDGQPILWWSTDPRMVLPTDAFQISHSLKKALSKVHKSMQTDRTWEVRFDSAFEQVMRVCAGPRQGATGTWISEQMIEAYVALHRLGYAHSSELWHQGELVGGAYGVCIGRMFYGESMFARTRDGSKIALAYLVQFLRTHDVYLIDCQQETGHLASLGARPISRSHFLAHVRTTVNQPAIQDWKPLPMN